MLVDILGRQLLSNNLVIWDLSTNEKECQGRYGLVISETQMYTLSKGFCHYDTTDCICYAVTNPTDYEIQIYNLLRQSYSVRIMHSMNNNKISEEEPKRVYKKPALMGTLMNKSSLEPGDIFEASNGLQVIYLGKMKVYDTYMGKKVVSGYAYLPVTKSWILNNYFDLSYYLSYNTCVLLHNNFRVYNQYLLLLDNPVSKTVVNHVNIEKGRYKANLIEDNKNNRLGNYILEVH